MSRQWMYMTDRRSMEFIDSMHEFIKLMRNTSTVVSFVVHAKTARMRRITHHQEPSTVTCSVVVSCRTIMFGPSMKKEELCWIIMKKKRTEFLTLQPITVPFFMTLRWVSPGAEPPLGRARAAALGPYKLASEYIC